MFADFLEHASKQGQLRSDLDARTAARVIFGIIQSSAMLYMLSGRDRLYIEEPEKLIEVVFKGMR